MAKLSGLIAPTVRRQVILSAQEYVNGVLYECRNEMWIDELPDDQIEFFCKDLQKFIEDWRQSQELKRAVEGIS